jgi:hypothetical protein
MYATIRRYEAVDQARTSEVVKKVDESLVPRLSKLPALAATTSSRPATAS